MRTDRLPLVGVDNLRGIDGTTQYIAATPKDQRFKGGYVVAVDNPIQRSRSVYFEKRPGLKADTTIAANKRIYDFIPDPFGLGGSNKYLSVIDTIGDETSFSLYLGTTALLVVSKLISGWSMVTLSGVDYLFMTEAGNGNCHFISSAAISTGVTFTGDTHTNTTIDNISSTTGLLVGQTLSGTNIAASTRIASIDSATQITTTIATTGTTAGVTITRGRTGKILDADFPTTAIGDVVEIDGYLVVGTTTGKVYNSDLNSLTSWSASGFLSMTIFQGAIRTVKKADNRIVAFGENGIEYFYNAGNASGSPLSRVEGLAQRFGTELSRTEYGNWQGQVAQYNDILFFRSGKPHKDSKIFMLEHGRITEISNPIISKIITDALRNSFARIWITAFSFAGQTFLHVGTGILTAVTLDADDTLDFWWSKETQMWTSPNFSTLVRIRDYSTGAINNDRAICACEIVPPSGGSPSGKIYTLHASSADVTYQDNAAAFSMSLQTSKWDGGTGNWKFIHSVTLGGSDVQASGTATLEYSDDDYATWTTAGTFDMTNATPRIWGLGGHRGGRAYRLTHSANTAFRAQFLDINYTASPV